MKQEFKNVYFVGAGGIGMAALERYYLSRGLNVAGYDRTLTPLTEALASEGVSITTDNSIEAIPEQFRNPDDTLVIYTPAIPQDHPQLKYFRDNRFEVIKRARALGLITRDSLGLCFAGTHGKTTTSSMAAHLLHSTPGAGCNAFLGGILRNYDSNLLLSRTSPYSVIEADEYDRSFHQLTPYIAVITSTDPDHLDIYGTEEAYLESFTRFTELIRPGGHLLMHTGLKFTPAVQPGVTVNTYSASDPTADYHAANIRRADGTITFDLCTPRGVISDISLGVPVDINIDNSIAAMAACDLAGHLDPDTARAAMASFMGPKRRFEFYLREPARAVIDDYAHHPDELRASIRSVKALYPGRELTVVFQPHLYSRTRDFADGFAKALSEADEVILLDIYPAREEPIAGVTSKLIFDKLTCAKKSLINKNKLVDTIKNRNFEILLTAGAGDIADYPAKIVESIK